MFRKHTGTSTLEWVVVAILVVGIVGGALIALSTTIFTRIHDINVSLGG